MITTDQIRNTAKHGQPLRSETMVEIADRLDALEKENSVLRGLLGNSAKDCPYCGLPAVDQAKCQYGFPGCSRTDDQMLSKHFADAYRANEAEKREHSKHQQYISLKDRHHKLAVRFTSLEAENAALLFDSRRLRELIKQDRVNMPRIIPFDSDGTTGYSSPEEILNAIDNAI